MSKNKVIHTYYGCPEYYDSKGNVGAPFSTKHCGQDHWKCPYYSGEGEPLSRKFDIKPTKLDGDYAVQQSLYDNLLNDIRNDIAKQIANNYDELAFSKLSHFGITKYNWKDHVNRVEIIEQPLVRHFYIDHRYAFSIFTENDLSEFYEEHSYKITTNYRIEIIEDMIR